MDQQDHTGRGPTALRPLVGAAQVEAGRVPASTVVSEGGWLAVSTEGFSEQQRGRPLTHLVKELVQNALDSVGSAGRIGLEFMPTGSRTASVRCADDGPGAEDLTQLNVVFVTGKKDGVTQRGRMAAPVRAEGADHGRPYTTGRSLLGNSMNRSQPRCSGFSEISLATQPSLV